MGLESGTYLDDLDVNNPLGTDERTTADNHLRLIKEVLKNTFPNVDGAVNPTPAQLNFLVGVTSLIQEQLDAKQATITGSATTIDTEDLTANRAVISNGSQKIAVSDVTDTELGYLDGVTGAIQTQFGTKGDKDTAQAWTKGQRGEITALSDGATITPDMDDSNNFSVTLGGDRTLANPSNLTAGQSGCIFITQDGTGTRTLGYGTYWDFAGGTDPVLTTTAAAVDVLSYVVRSY